MNPILSFAPSCLNKLPPGPTKQLLEIVSKWGLEKFLRKSKAHVKCYRMNPLFSFALNFWCMSPGKVPNVSRGWVFDCINRMSNKYNIVVCTSFFEHRKIIF